MLLGDPPLFPQHEEVELSWKILDPVIEYWAKHGNPDTYEAGTWGPASADEDARPRRPDLEAAVTVARTPAGGPR